MEQLPSRLKSLRLGYSKTAPGSILGVSRRTVYAWEIGEKEPTTSNIIQLARLYGVTSDYLLAQLHQKRAAGFFVLLIHSKIII